MKYISFLAAILWFSACSSTKKEETKPKIVFIMGDEEYRSEESLPMLAKILKREMGAEIALCYAVDSVGNIDPNSLDHIEGLEALEDADLMVMFTRFRALPDEEAKYILDYAESGRPMVGFRTATHSFLYKDDSTKTWLNNEWPTKVWGQQWITHHGHFADGHGRLTDVSIMPNIETPILNGVQPFEAYSWLYHVDGGEWHLAGDCKPFLEGRSLRSNHEMAGRLDQFPLTNPVAWTKTYTGESGKAARVFFTTLGHPYDFKIESMRKLALNGIYWALGKEADIPENGVNAEPVDPYEPNNSGMGHKYKKGMKPAKI
ncbi:ThuA domain-containing protein [Marinilongibacter aquaticus]|uniref:ThuA domain-containing protein n=1 Tax=Marinilongibacter aquaticus TaxID=2975157 RepID=UPI0021BD506E|nr:ThuA domain-containing protein [Marinilongibacter aquaticus]UBM57523.1 ThuA domain-containing protein [Marinilongibacter aquaticus]